MDAFRALTSGLSFKKRKSGEAKPRPAGSVSEERRMEDAVAELAEIDIFASSKPPLKQKPSSAMAIIDDASDSFMELKPEEVAEFRGRHKIRVYGTDIPAPVPTFAKLLAFSQRRDEIIQVLRGVNVLVPTPIQMQVVPLMLSGRDVVGCAATGSGKTLAFALPYFAKGTGAVAGKKSKKEGKGVCRGRMVVVEPTRELASQVYDVLRMLDPCNEVKTVALSKPLDASTVVDFDILVTTPLRLVEEIEHGRLDLSNVRTVVLDEADRLLDMGLVSQTDAILAACTHKKLQKCMFSATMPAGVESLAVTILRDPVKIVVGSKNAAAETISQRLVYCGADEAGKLIAVRNLTKEGGLKPPVLVFVQSIERARELYGELVYDGVRVDVMHSDRTREQRETVVKNFRNGVIWVLITTELMARGIDFHGVNLVINFDFPQTVQSYIHRIGRTGRAGQKGEAVTFFTNDDAGFLRSIANVMKESGCEVPAWMLALKKPSARMKLERKTRPVARDHISTRTMYDHKKRAHHQQVVKDSKRKRRAHDGS